jgi:hypothetical protein
MKKIITIIKSRFKNRNKTQQVKNRREECKGCEFNSTNIDKIPLNRLFWKNLSDLYSWICGTLDEDSLGNCLGCKQACSIYYKTAETEELCPKNKWK